MKLLCYQIKEGKISMLFPIKVHKLFDKIQNPLMIKKKHLNKLRIENSFYWQSRANIVLSGKMLDTFVFLNQE